MKLKLFLLGLFFSLFLGITIIVIQLQHNVQLRTIIEKKIQKEIQQFCKCKYNAELGKVTFLSPSITLENVTLYDPHNEWEIHLKKIIFETSWLSYINYGTFLITCTLDTATIKSSVTGAQWALINHFSSLGQSLPSSSGPGYVTPHRINFQDIVITGTNPYIDLVTTFKINGTCFINNTTYMSSGTISESNIMLQNRPLLTSIAGQWVYNSSIIDNQRQQAGLLQGKALFLNGIRKEYECTIEAVMDKSYTLHLFNNSTLDFTYIMDNSYSFTGSATFPCQYLQDLRSFTSETLQGTAHITYEGDFTPTFKATIALNNIGIKQYSIPTALIQATRNKNIWEGTYAIAAPEKGIEGKWNYDSLTQYFTTELANNESLTLGTKDWQLAKNTLAFSCELTHKNIEGKYAFTLQHVPTDTLLKFDAHYLYANNTLQTNGTCNSYTFEGEVDTLPTIVPQRFICFKENKQPLITYEHIKTSKNEFEMNVSYDLFYNALEQFADYSLPGNGDLHIQGTLTPHAISGTIKAPDALIRIPDMYNFLSQFKTQFSIQFSPFIIECKNLEALLHKGTITAHSLLFGYHQDNFFMHLPFQFYKCLANKKNSFFAQTSGSVLFSKKRLGGPELSGTVIIEKGHMRENPFSLEGQQDVTSSILPSVIFEDKPLNLHLHILTKESLVIKTPQLSSQADCNVTINNTLQEPHLKGSLNLTGGTIEFPYKPLTITTGHVYFVPNGRNDHQLEIGAQGIIKNYNVLITVTGTAADPHIALTSSPTLPEEQIISLLYTGSTQDSLNMIIPTFLMSNIQQRILGAAQQNDPTKFSWRDTLKRIHILPSFADQSGRGGFRGTIEIDISDRLRATLQKNFSLSEDTRIEVEYDLTDDIVIKGIKDERSDIGAEVEMRFKF